MSIDMTVSEAQDLVEMNLEDGIQCPVCHQHAQKYRWSLYSTAIKALILMYREGGTTEYVSTRRLKELGHTGQGDATRLRLWGLAEQNPDPREDGGKSGEWRVTKKGEGFLMGNRPIRQYVWTYNGERLSFDGGLVYIGDCVGNKFNFQEMMSGVS